MKSRISAVIAAACFVLLAFPVFAWASDSADKTPGAAVFSTGAPSVETQPATTVDAPAAVIDDGLYNIATAIDSGKFIEMPGASTANQRQAALYADNATLAQRWRITRDGNGLYTIVNANSGKALDVPAASARNGQKIQQYTANGTLAQKWKIEVASDGNFIIRSALDGRYVLDVPARKAVNGNGIQLYTDNGTAAQHFKLKSILPELSEGFYVLSNKGSGRALDVAGASFANGANVRQYDANGTLAQTYKASYNENTGYYALLNVGSGLALDVAGGGTANGANVWQYSSNNTPAQHWDIRKNSDGSYTLRSAKSGKALDVRAGSTANGANVQLYAPNGTAAQRWTFKAQSNWLPDGTYIVHSSRVQEHTLTVAGGSIADSANVQLNPKNSANAQRFYLRSVGNGYYTIQNTYSGRYLDAASASSAANVSQTGTREQWKPVLTEGGICFQLKDNANIVLDLAGASTAPGANVRVFTSNNSAAQKWLLRATELLADGTYTIGASSNSTYVVDVPGKSTENGRQLQVYSANGTTAQVFSLRSIGSGKYQITNYDNGHALEAKNSQLVQQAPASRSAQEWKLVLNANGTTSIVSVADASSRVTLDGQVANGTKLTVAASNGKATQNWMIRSKAVAAAGGTVSYDTLSITINQMASIEGAAVANLDPANVNKYQFLDLRHYTGTTAEQLDKALQSLAPWIGPGNPLYQSGKYFVEAAKKYNVNEVFLLIHAGQETGWGESAMFGGYYNFFGVDGGAGTAAAAASNAAARGWTTVEKGIVGGAQFIAEEWVYRDNYPQHSPYALRYDYNYVDKARQYSHHHYTTSDQWMTITANHLQEAYKYTGTEKNACFVYPKYKS